MSERDDVLNQLVQQGPGGALVMDFDGVLSPIVTNPAASQLLDGTAALLESLVGRLGVVAVLSGRPVSFLAERVLVPGVMLLGSYGSERRIDGQTVVRGEVQAWLPQVRTAREQLLSRLDGRSGIHVEDKDWAVAVHWRNAPDRPVAERLVALVAAEVAWETGLRPEPGKAVIELRPPVDEDKGTALHRLQQQTGCLIVGYAGDDLGDLPAFAAVTELGGYPLVVRSVEMATEVSDVDGVHFESPKDFADWLRRVTEAFG